VDDGEPDSGAGVIVRFMEALENAKDILKTHAPATARQDVPDGL
jgi:hypothetical protein